MTRRRRRGLLPLAAPAALLALPGAASAATVSGTAFEDFNDNGVRDLGTPAATLDRGVAGITVTAYGADGAAIVRGTTAPDGSYSLTVPDSAGRIRLEFTGLPAGYQPARHGARSGTTVQFTDVSGGNVSGLDVGVLQPVNYCQDNPQLAIACAQFGAHDGAYAGSAAIRLVPDTVPNGTLPDRPGADGSVPGQRTGATFGQVGTIFGVAQPQGSRYLYSSAYTKRHASYGPGGPGAIYRTDIDQANAGTPNATLFFDVNSLAGNPAGTPTRATDGWLRDRDAYDAVGNSGLGNIVTNLDGSELFTVGLATRELVQIPIPADGSAPASARTFSIPNGACAVPGDARPMGLGFNVSNGLVYVGGVCSEASRDVGPLPIAASPDLRLFVYTFDPAAGTFSSTPVMNESLDPERLCIYRTRGTNPFPDPTCATPELGADWHPWTARHPADVPPRNTYYNQPLLSDIEFVGDDLVLGVRDRSADQMTSGAESLDGGSQGGIAAGYTLRACVSGAGGYALESGASCGALTNVAGQIADYGPGDGLFYWQQYHGSHDYTGNGGVLSIPGSPDIRQTGYDTIEDGPLVSGGLLYMDKDAGTRTKAYHLYQGDGSRAPPSTFNKANGLGDLEALCASAPIEIGNYVWLDLNKDGVQDPDETPIDGVTVELLDDSGTVIATTVTDARGQYYFNESNVAGGIQPDTRYTVRIPLAQPRLATLSPTIDHAGDPLRDSNGVEDSGYVIDPLRTGAAGHNDHTHDFGFILPFNVSIRKTASSPTVKLGETVTYTLTVRNHGPGLSSDVTVRDALPAELALTGVTTSRGTCTTSGNSLECALGRLTSGQTETVTVAARAVRSGRAVNTATVRSPGDRDPSDDRDDEEVEIPTPDVSIKKTASARVVKLGESVTYTLTARNNGPGIAEEVVVTDALPERLALTGVTTPVGTCATTGNALRCELGTLAEGEEVAISVTAKAVRSGRAVNTATITAREDEDPSNNRDDEEVEIPTPNVSIKKTASARTVKLGESVTYTLTARNHGPGIAEEVVVTDALPERLALTGVTTPVGTCSTSGNGLSCALGTLAEGEEVAISVTAKAVRSGRAVNTAVIRAREDRDPDDNRDDEEVEIPTPDVSIVKTVSARTVKLGQSVTYTLTARNNGPGIAEEVVVTDALPSRLKLTGVRTQVGDCTTAGNGLRCALGTLAEGQEVRITATAKAIKTGRSINTAVISAREDSNPDNNRDDVPVVTPKVDLGLTKTVNRTVLQAGQRAVFTIKVRNPSKAALRNVRVCDDLPTGLAFVNATPRAKLSKGRHCWTVKTLRAGQTKTFRVTVRALNGLGGRRVNVATATAPDANTRRAKRAVRLLAGDVKAGGVTG